MKEIRAVAVFVFRMEKGKHYFYLVKRGKNIPYFPSTWTPIASIISDKDIELYEQLRKKHGDIVEGMLDKVTVLRLLLQRNLIVDPDFNLPSADSKNIREKMLEIDQVHLNVLLHTIIPSGYRSLLIDEQYILPNYYLFVVPAYGSRKKMKLSQYSDFISDRGKISEEIGKWFQPSEVLKKRYNLTELVDSSITTLMEFFYNDKEKLVDIARKLEQDKTRMCYCRKGVLPYIWRFKTPAHGTRPFSESNVYVIGNERKYIIDPGSTTENNLAHMNKFLDENIDTLEGILLTNTLPDHVNQALYFKDKYDLPLFSSQKTAEVLIEEGFIFNSYLKNGDKITLGSYDPLGIKDWSLEVLDLPGYTQGHMGFYDPRGVVFIGSLFHKNIIGSIESYPGVYSDLMSSYQRVLNLKAKYAFSGHRDLIVKPNVFIKLNLKEFSKYEPLIIKLLKAGITSKEEIKKRLQLRANYKWDFITENVVNIILEKLIEENKINRRGEDFFWLKTTLN